MINILLNGCNGKMGKVIAEIVDKDENSKIVCGIDIKTDKNSDFPVYTSSDSIKEKADVIIDFSHPSALDKILNYAISTNTAIVIATTGLSKEQTTMIADAAYKIPVFYSANMSLGVNLLIDLAKKATKLLSDNFDIEIIEKHHNQKIDAPSGTALAIADAISNELEGAYNYVYDRHSIRKKREKNEIGIHAVRGGTIVGEHDIIFAGNNEIVTLSHSAANREIFAEGAVKAAKYLAFKSAGFYNMDSLINEI